MTTLNSGQAAVDDRRFYGACMIVMALVVIAGFSVQLLAGRSSFKVPAIIHLHALATMGWLGLVIAQGWLARANRIALHRRLGWLTVLWSGVLLILAPLVTIAAVQTGRTPFFFQPQPFLISNILTLLPFVAMLAAAIALRRQADWHMRLQVCAVMMLMGPGIGRLVPMPLLVPYAFEVGALIPLLFPVIGLVRDWRRTGKAHPAWWWGIGALLATLALARLASFSDIGANLYAATIAGHPQAQADGLAFPPPPPHPPMP